MNYKDHYKDLANEAEVPFSAGADVQQGLRAKYGEAELDAYTFGIELEFTPEEGDYNTYDWDQVHIDMSQDDDVLEEYREHVKSERNRLNKNWNGNIEDWDDSYGPVDGDTFNKYNPDPDRDAYDNEDDYNAAYDAWRDKLDKVEKEYKYWKDYDLYDNLSDFITTLDPFDYVDMDSYETKRFDMGQIVDNAIDYISDEMHQLVNKGSNSNKTHWAVGPDADVVEIRSKHLNQNEFDLVKQICDYVTQHNTSGRTSAHVHIGLPKDFDAFDLLALTTLVDEKAIKATVGPDRALDAYASLRDSLHKSIYNVLMLKQGEKINKSFYISNKNVYSALENIDRNHGTNVTALMKHGTIEFRYLDSRITSNPDLFINWIKYFLILPKIAQSRNKITLAGLNNNIIVVRESGGMRFYIDRKAPTVNFPAKDIKQATPINTGKYIT